MYSTPTAYVTAKKAEGFAWEVREGAKGFDVFPLADNSHNYWSGYFTSRPGLKRQVRFASNFLNAARQLEVITGLNASALSVTTVRPSPDVGPSWTDSYEGTIGVATHHDGMSGTERQDVTNDYELRISESHGEVEQGVGLALAQLVGNTTLGHSMMHCNCNAHVGDCLNMSVCAATTDVESFTMFAWNNQGQATTPWLSLPVSGPGWVVSTVNSVGEQAAVASQVTKLDERTLGLPLLYLNSFKMSAEGIAAANRALSNNATHSLQFQVELPPLGFTTMHFTAAKVGSTGAATVSQSTSDTPSSNNNDDNAMTSAVGQHRAARRRRMSQAKSGTITNGMYTIGYDESTGLITTLTNEVSKITTPFKIDWGWYKSSEGGCTGGINATTGKYDYKLYGCSGQHSGAYIFRPNSTTVYPCGASAPTLTVVTGAVVNEIQQSFGPFCTHVVRLRKNDNFVEVEWTAGPIPIDQPWIPAPPAPAPPAGQCKGWTSASGGKKDCSAEIETTEAGSCACDGGTFTVTATDKHVPFTCNLACGGFTCDGGWRQTAGCGPNPEPSNNKDCAYEIPSFASGYCQCSMGHVEGGKAWKNWGCTVQKGGSCNDVCMQIKKDNWGKEVILRYSSGLQSKGKFETDANGREMVPRLINGRSPSYPAFVENEPVAANYFPVNSMIALNDGAAELVVLTDVSQGGASLAEGELELMVHRRLQADDSRGVQVRVDGSLSLSLSLSLSR